MATLDQAINRDTSGYTRVPFTPPPSAYNPEDLFVRRNPNQVCSLPYLPGTFPSTDSIVGFGLAGKSPQWRAPLPATQNNASNATTSSTAVTTSSSSSTSTNNPPKSQTASITTPVLNPGTNFAGTILLAKGFTLQFVTVSGPSRVEIYSTSSAQSADLFRDSNTPVGYGNEQGIIGEFNLIDAPVVWTVTPPASGFNGDTPQSNVIYITVTNIGPSSQSITVTLTYVPTQS